ncbi:hypothetical protein [Sorangium sp. So ce124]|uniref:hypothetical protein n=1 Tax=Sorangium sp. So ce124 TaxID=3133280 RepID=UPI003F5ED3D5
MSARAAPSGFGPTSGCGSGFSPAGSASAATMISSRVLMQVFPEAHLPFVELMKRNWWDVEESTLRA